MTKNKRVPKPSSDIGSIVRILRKNAGINQRSLATSAGIPQQTLFDLERGCSPKYDTLSSILAALQVTKAEFDLIRDLRRGILKVSSSQTP